ncbi:MAG: GNAT family N-acetyltransferase [Promethearchaeota archaeon]
MENKENLKSLKYEPLSEENLEFVHQMCEESVLFISHQIQTFQKVTLGSALFDPDFSLVASDVDGNIIAFFMIVFRRSQIFKKRRRVAVLKFFVVKNEWRCKGLGTIIYTMLEERIKKSKKKCFRMKLEVMTSMPDYWLPGLDPRHTEAFFFLKKQGFKKGTERINLCLNIEVIPRETPPLESEGYKIMRATLDDKEELVPLKFMPKIYQLSFWPEEIALSFQNDTITTFIAREPKESKIIGWASHSIHFPGSFGPTGVKKSSRGRGIGSLLLNWCLWDMKQVGVKKATIMWVEGDTIYFYLKSKGARICEFYWTMKKNT